MRLSLLLNVLELIRACICGNQLSEQEIGDRRNLLVGKALEDEQWRLLHQIKLVSSRLGRQRERAAIVTRPFGPERHVPVQSEVASDWVRQLGVLFHEGAIGHCTALRKSTNEHFAQALGAVG